MNKTTQKKSIFEARKSEQGYSMIELVIVVMIIAIMSVVAIMSLTSKKMFEADSQTLQIIDFFHEARQRSLSQRATMRVEINATLRMIRLIDEKLPGNASDDVVIKASGFMDNGVFIGSKPANVSNTPTELSPVPVTAFASSTHPLSSGNSVIVLRFQRNGTVVNAGTNAVGAGATPTGSTIYIWSKYVNDNSPNPTKAQVMRAITVLASSGSSRMWKCLFANEACSVWTK